MRDELLVGSGFWDPSVCDDEDAVHVRQVGQTMGHEDTGLESTEAYSCTKTCLATVLIRSIFARGKLHERFSTHLLSTQTTKSWKMLMNNKFKAHSLNRKSYRIFTLSWFSVTCFKHVGLLDQSARSIESRCLVNAFANNNHGWPSTQPGSLHTALQRKYTQPCSLFSRGTAVLTMGARLCQQWGTAVCKCPAV